MPLTILNPVWIDGVQKLEVVPQPPPKPAQGLLPPTFNDEVHFQRCLEQVRSKTEPMEKYIYLSHIRQTNYDLFYRLCLTHLTEITPLIYTPTVGDACQNFSHIYRNPEGMFVTISDKGNIKNVLRNWPRRNEARISVVTDGSRILGLGDLGINGMPISIGKLSLYVAGAGIRPESVIPICLDLGTNTQKYLDDPLYLGRREKRVSDEVMEEFMVELMQAMHATFPNLLVQFEDFSTDNAFKYLDLFRDQYTTFNDDIQGTGAVVLSGFVNAAKLSSEASGRPLSGHRILFLGAGSAGVGVAKQLTSFFRFQGLTEEEARDRIWLVDSQGLVFHDRGKLAEHKKYFARRDYSGPVMKSLIDIISYVKPTALLGLSTIKDAFTQEVVELMAEINPCPIIFPLSNPVRLSECEFHNAVTWTKGSVLFASGSPFQPFEYEGKIFYPGQGNNFYIFPGLGLGSILSRASCVTDEMVEASALALADAITPEEAELGLIYPRITRMRDISTQIACRVIRTAQMQGVDENTKLRNYDESKLRQWVQSKMWVPRGFLSEQAKM